MPTFLGTLALDVKDPTTTISDTGTTIQKEDSSQNEAIKRSILPPDQLASCVENMWAKASHINSISINSIPVIDRHKITTDKAIVLESASYGFRRPNILDVKLGVRLWADDAPEEKRIRLDQVTAESTHKDLGCRIAGMRVWQGHAAKGEGIDQEGYKTYDKNYGKYSVKKDNIHKAFKNFIFNTEAGINEDLGKYVGQALLADVTHIQSILESHENRFFSSSLLFVFEGDGEALRAAIDESSQPSQSIDDCEDDELVKPKICSVKLIDFAHAEWTPGRGPDENTLIGVRNVANILNDISVP